MTFPVKDWKDANTDGGGDHSTPLTAVAFEDLEARLSTYSDAMSPVQDARLDADTAVGATSLTLDRNVRIPSGLGCIAIDPFTTSCEIRKLGTTSGKTATVTALKLAHTSGARVFFFQNGHVPAAWFGALGNNSANDEPALQWGLRETAAAGGLWLEGENRGYRINAPIVAPASAKIRHLNVNAFSPMVGDPNGAMLMNMQGFIRAFTADATTDLVTTTDGVHGMGSASPFTSHHGVPVLFKGTSLPGGITSGKVYYAWATSANDMRIASNRASGPGTTTSGSNIITAATASTTTTAFAIGMRISEGNGSIPQGTTITAIAGSTITMSATATATVAGTTIIAGNLVDITSSGSGTAYCELMSQQKLFIDDVLLNGASISGLNGVAIGIQQPGYARKLRLDNFPGTGLTMTGQQMIFENLEIINCGTGIAFEDMAEGYFYGTDIEGSVTLRAVHFRSTAQIFVKGGATSIHFSGWHDELANANAVTFDLEGAAGLLVQNAHTSNGPATQKFIYSHAGLGSTAYSLDQLYFSSASPGGPTLIDDPDRGHTILAWDSTTPQNNRRYLNRWDAPSYSSSFVYPERHPIRVLRPGGGYIGWLGQHDGVESVESRPGSGQTAPQFQWLDKSGNAASWVNKDGYLATGKTAAPSSGDLANGTFVLWLDQTAGAAALKVTGKDSAGTVFTRTLST